MSKKLNKSVGAGTPKNNTLFKYFAKSPALSEKKKIQCSTNSDKELEKENMHNEKNTKTPEALKRKLDVELSGKKQVKLVENEEDDIAQCRKKRRIILPESDEEEEEEPFNASDDEDDYKPGGSDAESSSDESMESVHSNDISNDISNEQNDEEEVSSCEKPKRNKEPVPKSNNKKLAAGVCGAGSFMQKLQAIQEDANNSKVTVKKGAKYDEIVCSSSTLDEPVIWPHQKLEFLKPENIKDKNGNRPDHESYDSTTLQVPAAFLNSLSPGVRQWWVLKSDNFDCVLFFKVGKFYELYHMDADVGVNELGFTYMRGEFAHAGFPEVSFDKMASILVDRGYKIARVEQTETPDMMTERCKQIKPTKFDKVVRREICQITNRGTQVFGSQCQITPNHQPNYMLAVVEQTKMTASKYGICFIDTSIGDFYMGEFEDDKNCSRLLTLLAHHMPVLVIYEKSSLSERTQQIMRTVLSGVIKETLPNSGANACNAEQTLKILAEKYYSPQNAENSDNWPLTLRCMQAESDHLGLTPHDAYRLTLKALGLCLKYMRKCHLEEKVVSMARFNFYTPPDLLNEESNKAPTQVRAQPQRRMHMVLDATTLSNLRITGEEHSLLSTVDHCCTKFGKRLLHHWVCSPSCDINTIVERQSAISDLLQHTTLLQEARALLAPMPDFERHLAQIHLFGNKKITQNHPDGRAILFEDKLYNKKKIQNFIGILKGFESLTKLPLIFMDCKSPLIVRITQLAAQGGIFPDLTELLTFFKKAFDHEAAAKSGVVAPESGVDNDFDACELKIVKINEELKAYLIEQEKYFGCRLGYFGTDKKRFQLEVPESNSRKAGKEYQLEGQKKGNKPCRRFSTNETRNLLKKMQNAEDERNVVLKDLARRIFEKFSNHYEVWKQCVDCVSHLDVLCSLAEYARNQNVICVPELHASDAKEKAFIEVEEGYHPCVSSSSYIPNGIKLGNAAGTAPLSILTGPNMGGKSTLMRQVGLLVVMAQIGAHVPAQRLSLSIVDRIFTRLGAQDDILAGHSTFLVELNETSLILKHATINSLVLLDELGRGTATYDGTAIAASVVNFLADLKCRTLFSTHYHNLIDYFDKDTRIALGHMACMVENEDTEDPTQETVTFLYKYSTGACPKSYGFNAAKLAGMPHAIIKRAYALSKEVEAIALKRKIAAKIVSAANDEGVPSISSIQKLILQLRGCRV